MNDQNSQQLNLLARLNLKRPISLESSETESQESESKKKTKFVRTYTLFDLILMGFGNVVGSGIFTLTG